MGSILSRSVNTIYTESDKSNDTYSVYSCVNGFRKTNEDAHILAKYHNNYICNGVFDGHCGSDCSNFIAKELFNHIFNDDFEDNMLSKDYIIKKCIDLDKYYLESLGDISQSSGTTATFSITQKLNDGKYKTFICNIGDSMTILLKKNNNYNPCFFSLEHKPELPEEENRIKLSGGYVCSNGRVCGNLAVSRAFGDMEFKTKLDYTENYIVAIPDVTEFECEEGDIIIHMCDGITESEFTPQQVCDYIKENINLYSDLEILSSLICLEALRRNSKDNLSCMIIKLQNCEKQEKKIDIIPGTIHNEVYFYDSYKNFITDFDFDFKLVLEKRLKIIENYEKSHNYETEFEKVLFKHHLIETREEFEKEKYYIKKIINNIL